MSAYVNIVISDHGWILERLASEIAQRYPDYIIYDDNADPGALINYYITYSARRQKVSPIEVGLFTHIENVPATRKLFFDTARNMTHCVCMSDIYTQTMHDNGIHNVSTINPGVDLENFTPKLQIGVVGRTYKTGRKGEALVASLLDIPWIKWHFTGEGWPGPALNLPYDKMPDFYRKMDYILVPALYEGGPMCVIEALACGTDVIAPPIGWVSQFEHIEYKTGDAEDLRRVLTALYEKKLRKAQGVAHLTWDAWADQHHLLFQKLAQTYGESLDNQQTRTPKSGLKVALVSQADEKKSKGGPSVRVPITIKLLNRSTHFSASPVNLGDPFPEDVDIIHAYNSIKNSSDLALESAWRNQTPAVLSPIFLDPTCYPLAYGVKQIFKEFYNDEDTRWRIRELTKETEHNWSDAVDSREHERMQKLLDRALHVISLSQHELSLLKKYRFHLPPVSIVHNPVNPTPYLRADPELFKKTYNLDEYILCVGRIEIRKNQLMLAYALKDTGLTMVLAGHTTDPEYLDLVKKYGSKNIILVDRLEANSPMLASAYAGCRVYCLPSFSEGASLANLEAAASGCNMVVSNRSSEKEYFGNFARYCDPADVESIRDTILDAWKNPISPERKKQFQEYVQANYSWDRHVAETAKVYDQALLSHRQKEIPVSDNAPQVYIDVTWTAKHPDVMCGFSRIEREIASHLSASYRGSIRYIAWSETHRTFVEIGSSQFMSGDCAASLEGAPSINRYRPGSIFKENGVLLVLGSEWMLNDEYSKDLVCAVYEQKLRFIPMVHDIAVVKYPQLGIERDKRIKPNLIQVLKAASEIITSAEHSRKDLAAFMNSNFISYRPIHLVRYGDGFSNSQKGQPNLGPVLRIVGGRRFVIYISAIDIRKNHAILFHVWERLIEKYGVENTPHLLCVGYGGRKEREIVELRNSIPLLNQRVQILRDLDDKTIEWLYRNCLFTVYPSFYEGWGLPVGEAISRGRICIASNKSSIPEVAGNLADLIDPLDFISWYDTIEKYIQNPSLRKLREAQLKQYKLTSWDETAQTFNKVIRDNKGKLPEWPDAPCQPVKDFTSPEIAPIFGDGWHAVTENGIEAMGAITVLLFRLPSADIAASAELYLTPGADLKTLKFLVNGQPVLETSIENANAITCIIPVPTPETATGQDLNVRIDIAHEPQTLPGTAFTLHSINFRMNNLDADLQNNILRPFRAMSPRLGNAVQYLLSSRSDLTRTLAEQSGNMQVGLLLWLWVHGLEESRELACHKDDLARMLITETRRTAEEAHISGYTCLIHSIWISRPDLRTLFDTTTEMGQRQMLKWYNDFGRHEYKLDVLK